MSVSLRKFIFSALALCLVSMSTVQSYAAVVISDDLKDCVTDAYDYTGGATGTGYA